MRIIIVSFSLIVFLAACEKTPAPSAAPAGEVPAVQAQAASPAGASANALKPVEGVSLQPAGAVHGQAVQAVVEDAQRRILQFTWFANGAELAGETGDRIPGKYVKKGMRIRVRVVPVAGSELGESVESAELVVGNSAPRIASIDLVSSEGGEIVLQTRAEDVDGDALAYRLVNGPAGMSVDAQGVIRWAAGEIAAPVTFSVGVSDGEAEYVQESTIGMQ